jgi:hypothetical protein
MADPHEPLLAHDGEGLTTEQLDGRHCIVCDHSEGPMIPAYDGPRGQLFLHPACDDRDPELLELETQPQLGMDHPAVIQYCAGYAPDVDAESVWRFLERLGVEPVSCEAVDMAIEAARVGDGELS